MLLNLTHWASFNPKTSVIVAVRVLLLKWLHSFVAMKNDKNRVRTESSASCVSETSLRKERGMLVVLKNNVIIPLYILRINVCVILMLFSFIFLKCVDASLVHEAAVNLNCASMWALVCVCEEIGSATAGFCPSRAWHACSRVPVLALVHLPLLVPVH